MLNEDEIPLHQLIDMLARTRMPVESKGLVIKYRRQFQSGGALPTPKVLELKVLFRRYRRRIKTDEEARERARISMARERIGMTEAESKVLQQVRINEMRRKVEDFGI